MKQFKRDKLLCENGAFPYECPLPNVIFLSRKKKQTNKSITISLRCTFLEYCRNCVHELMTRVPHCSSSVKALTKLDVAET